MSEKWGKTADFAFILAEEEKRFVQRTHFVFTL